MKKLMENDLFKRTLRRLAHEVLEQHLQLDQLILVGILNKGYRLAQLLQALILEIQGKEIPLYPLEIRPYRDDEKQDLNVQTQAFNVDKKIILLVDDVLFTGRSVRAGIDAIMAMGRPALIRLVVLIDRGHRQIPIRPDLVGKNIATNYFDQVEVNFETKTVSIK
jgi:pyrimidine operon attenuation protein/uracil phosphoribosyltransferase